MSDEAVKSKVLQAAGQLDMLSAMGMNRAARRAMAKINCVPAIRGSVKPFYRPKT